MRPARRLLPLMLLPLFAPSASHAAVYDLGDLFNSVYVDTFFHAPGSQFTDTFLFSLSTAVPLTIMTSDVRFPFFELQPGEGGSILNGDYTATLYTDGQFSSQVPFAQGSTGDTIENRLLAGPHQFEYTITGNAVGTGGAAYTLAISGLPGGVTPVPELDAQWILAFGIALVGWQLTRRQRGTNASQACALPALA